VRLPNIDTITTVSIPDQEDAVVKYRANRGGHAPRNLRKAFDELVEVNTFTTLKSVRINGIERTERWLVGQLWNCTDAISEFHYEVLGMDFDGWRRRHTYGAAVRAFAEMRQSFACRDCELDTRHNDYYMVHNDIWIKAFGRGDGMLCIQCLEKRIARKLTVNDFTKCPVNEDYLASNPGRHGFEDRLVVEPFLASSNKSRSIGLNW